MTQGTRIYNGEKIVSSLSGAEKKWAFTCKRMKLEESLTPYTKINSKWFNDLNVRSDTIILLGGNIDKTFLSIFIDKYDIIHSNISLDQSPKAKDMRATITKWELIKLKIFCTTEGIIKKTKRQLMDWEKIFSNDATHKRLISKINNSVYKSISENKQPN